MDISYWMIRRCWPSCTAILGCLALHAAFGFTPLHGQQPAAGEPTRSTAGVDEGPLVADSTVGYLDNAIVGNQLRFRYDTSYGIVQPARAEFFWPVGGASGNGPGPETSLDYQDVSLYAESVMGYGWSLFGEVPFRITNPEIQDNTSGMTDANVGIKYGLCWDGCSAWTAQFRVYLPTGDGDRGLGTNHYSLEPGLLMYQRLSPRMSLFAELRDWIAVDGNEGFAGNVLRYGLGASYQVVEWGECQSLSAVAEFAGWTVLEGRTAITTAPPIVTTLADATGDTIVNAKFGGRWRVTPVTDVYVGYGRVLTEQTWYDDTVRLEIRRSF